jgi:serine/threonine protein kinase
VKVLGVGGTGIVYELLHKSNGQRFAMKEMEIKNKAQMQMAISEAEMLKDIMENVSHPNVMHIEKVFQVGSKFYLVFPLCTGGELYEHIIRRGHFTERDAAIITRDLISGLHALHNHDILHLDIKPENLLFDSMNEDAKIKITDFGLSKLFSDSTLQQQQKANKFSKQLMEDKLRIFLETGELNRDRLRGTIGYMSPELILCGHCCKGTDVFAAGVVLYILLSGNNNHHKLLLLLLFNV